MTPNSLLLPADRLGKRPWRRRATAVAIGTAMAYVLGNLMLVNLASCVHDLSITLEVVDGATAAPIPGATVAWAEGKHLASRAIGRTGADGQMQFVECVQENPWWIWPMIGSFQLANRVLRIEAPSYQVAEVPLSQSLPALPYSDPVGQVRVSLRRR